jgi:hypothetical protein
MGDNRQDIYIKDYPLIPIGSFVYRKPTTEKGVREGYMKLSIRVFDYDPEPFEIIEREEVHVGKYKIRSLVDPKYVPIRWYKPYELIVIPSPQRMAQQALSPLTTEYLRAKYGDQVVEQFIQRILPYYT